VAHLQDWAAAVREIQAWPEYQPQPLHALPHRANELGLASLHYKDESQRFGRQLASFKALGAPYAVYTLLRDAVKNQTGHEPASDELRSGIHREITGQVTVCVATDGNQGRGLAYAARTFGCRCVVYIHAHVSEGREAAMRNLGAIVIRIDGEYEKSVDRAREDARMNGWHFVSSTSWADFADPIPRSVMNGYRVMVEEALAQLPDPVPSPTCSSRAVSAASRRRSSSASPDSTRTRCPDSPWSSPPRPTASTKAHSRASRPRRKARCAR
jgi:diaminopropionate ammonia-lyase